MSKRKFKNGYSLVEVVIALSVIVVISIAALSTVLSSVATKQAAINKTEAQNFAENAWECFKVSDDDEKFVSNVNFAEGVTLAGGVAGENDFHTVRSFLSEFFQVFKFGAVTDENETDSAVFYFIADFVGHIEEQIITFLMIESAD